MVGMATSPCMALETVSNLSPPDPLQVPSWLGGALSGSVFVPAPVQATPTPQEMQLEIPGVRFERLIGRGGMGIVYHGIEAEFGRSVAVKILPEQLRGGGEDFIGRFEQEVAVMERLNHPNLVRFIAHGSSLSGFPYLVMEYVDGGDLAQLLDRERRLDPARTLDIALQVADALIYAHGMGVIHRDIKPGNILLTQGGRVMVADFGLARLENESGLGGLTQSFQVMGSIDYQAPETLILGAEVDERADLYAVGVVLYHLLVGQVPRGIFHLPSKLFPNIDPRIDTLLSNLMQQNPYERTATARDLRAALLDLQLRPAPASAAAVGKRWWQWWK